MSAEVAERQNSERGIDLLAAQRVVYSRAKVVRGVRAVFTAGLAAAGPLLALARPSLAPWVGAVAAFWGALAQVVLRRVEDRLLGQGAEIQDRFDRFVFGLDDAVEGELVDEDVHDAARGFKGNRGDLADWYTVEPGAPHLASALLAQRANLAWDGRQRRRYTLFLAGVVVLLLGVDLAVGIVEKLSFVDALLLLIFPSLPAFAHSVDAALDHHAAWTAKEKLLARVEKRWKLAVSNPATLTLVGIRQVQEAIYRLRCKQLPVPDFIHKFLRPGFEEDARRVVADRIAQLCLDEVPHEPAPQIAPDLARTS